MIMPPPTRSPGASTGCISRAPARGSSWTTWATRGRTGRSRRVGLAPALLSAFNSLLSVRRTGYSTGAFINAANQLRHLFTQFAMESSRMPRPRHQGSLDLDSIRTYMQDNIHQPAAGPGRPGRGGAPVQVPLFQPLQGTDRVLPDQALPAHENRVRLPAAGQLGMSVKAIAAELGYTDPLYFSRLFSKTMGMSPRAYRNSVQKIDLRPPPTHRPRRLPSLRRSVRGQRSCSAGWRPGQVFHQQAAQPLVGMCCARYGYVASATSCRDLLLWVLRTMRLQLGRAVPGRRSVRLYRPALLKAGIGHQQ